MKAVYKKAIKYLTLVPQEKHYAWAHPSTHLAGCLFRYCTPDGNPYAGEKGVRFGDPMQVSNGKGVAWTEEMTARLLKTRLPWQPWRLTVDNLYQLYEVQHNMDNSFRDRLWRREHRYALPYPWPDDDFSTEDIDGKTEEESDFD